MVAYRICDSLLTNCGNRIFCYTIGSIPYSLLENDLSEKLFNDTNSVKPSSVDPNFDVTYKSFFLVYSGGIVTWVPPGIFVISCTMHMTYFPFDDQICFFKVEYSFIFNSCKFGI